MHRRPRSTGPRPLILLLATALTSLVLQVAAPSVGAQDFVSEVAEEIDDRGYYIERGAELTEAEARRLAANVDDGVGFAVLAQGITPSAQAFADDVYAAMVDRRAAISALIVITPDELGAAVSQQEFEANAAADALDAVTPSGSAEAIVTDFSEAVSEQRRIESETVTVTTTTLAPAPAAAESGSGGGGGGVLLVLLVLVVGAIALFMLMKRSGARQRAKNLAKAKAEVLTQVNGLGSLIYDLDARLKIEGTDAARRRFEQAGSDYADLKRDIDDADSGPDVAEVASRVDGVKWSLESIEAELDGRPAPSRPAPRIDSPSAEPDRAPSPRRSGPDLGPLGRPGRRSRSRSRRSPGGEVASIDRSSACFFDPDHRSGTVPVSIESSRGEVAAFVCRSCARRLEAGERPAPRLLDVGDRQVAAAAAPSGYGGLGMSLPDLFNIKTGQMTSGAEFDWSREIDRPSTAGVSRRRRRVEALPGASSAGRSRKRSRRRRR